MQHLDEGAIHAWLDGALTPDEAAQVAEHAAACTSCAAAVAEARGLIAASSRILEALDDVPANVLPDVAAASMAMPLAAGANVPARPRSSDHALVAPAAVPPDISAARPRQWWQKKATLRIAAAIVVVATGTVVATRELNEGKTAGNVAPGGAMTASPRAESSSNESAQSSSRKAAEALLTRDRSMDELDKKVDRRAPASERAATAKQDAPSTAEKRAATNAATDAGASAAVPSSRNEEMLKAKTSVAEPASSPPARPSSVAAAPPATPPQSSAPAQPRMEANAPGIGSPVQLADSEVRGQGEMIRRRVYDIGGGVLVTLDATPPLPRADADAVREKSVAPHSVLGGRAGTAVSGLFQTTPETHTIIWQGAEGTTYHLTGKLSVADLERVRRSLPIDQ